MIITASGKRNLSGVVLEMCCALGKEQVVSAFALIEWNQHSGRPQRGNRNGLLGKSLQMAGQVSAVKHHLAMLAAFSRKVVMVAA
jgi:hypothetical protein